ncbi:MAG: adenylate cyclase regulatory domain-containing protein [Acidimicrobiales bacterium]
MDTDAWEEAGLYDPDDPGAGERLDLLEYLTARGASLEQLREARRQDRLPAVAGDLVMGTRPATLSVNEVAARSGVTVERLRRLLLSVGLPVDDDSLLPEGLETLIPAFEQGASLMGEDAILAFTRVLGASATNIAEAAVALFYAEMGPGTEREGLTEVERARVSEAATLAFTSVPEVLSRLLEAQFERATHRSVPSRAWGATNARDGQVVALGFVDLVGSTAWAEGLSLRDASLALSRFESAAWSSAVLAGGRVVKTIGDEVFFAAPSVDAACRIGTEVCRATAADPTLPPARGAVGVGLVTPREGDYFGPTVNLVSRLVKGAAPGELVVTETAAGELPTDRWAIRDLGSQMLRGLDRPVRAFAVTSTGPPAP